MRDACISKSHGAHKVNEWDKLTQTRSVRDYNHKFVKLMLYVKVLDTAFKITMYIKGLCKDIGADLKAQKPSTLEEAVMLELKFMKKSTLQEVDRRS